MKSDKRGFTLTELIIAMVITGILAGITVVSMQGMTHRAIVAEGVAGLGRFRQAIREYYNVNGNYPPSNSGTSWDSPFDLGLDITANELDGTYFSTNCYFAYRFNQSDPTLYIIYCFVGGGWNNAPKAAITARITTDPTNGRITMFVDNGTVNTYLIPNSGYPQQTAPDQRI